MTISFILYLRLLRCALALRDNISLFGRSMQSKKFAGRNATSWNVVLFKCKHDIVVSYYQRHYEDSVSCLRAAGCLWPDPQQLWSLLHFEIPEDAHSRTYKSITEIMEIYGELIMTVPCRGQTLTSPKTDFFSLSFICGCSLSRPSFHYQTSLSLRICVPKPVISNDWCYGNTQWNIVTALFLPLQDVSTNGLADRFTKWVFIY